MKCRCGQPTRTSCRGCHEARCRDCLRQHQNCPTCRSRQRVANWRESLAVAGDQLFHRAGLHPAELAEMAYHG